MMRALVVLALLVSSVRAEAQPNESVFLLCAQADLVVEGQHVRGNTVRLSKILKPCRSLPRGAAWIQVDTLSGHDRHVVTEFGERGRFLDAPGLVLFLKRDSAANSWVPLGVHTDRDGGGSTGVFWFEAKKCHGYQTDGERLKLVPGPSVVGDRRVPETVEGLRRLIAAGLEHSRTWGELLRTADQPDAVTRLASYMVASTRPVDKGGWWFSWAASRHMRELGPSTVPSIIKVLRASEESDDLLTALTVLQEFGPAAREAAPLLHKWLNSENTTRVHHALTTLTSIRDQEAVPHIRPLLKNGNVSLVYTAVEALGSLGDGDSYDAIAALIDGVEGKTKVADVGRVLATLYELDAERTRPLIAQWITNSTSEDLHLRLRTLLKE